MTKKEYLLKLFDALGPKWPPALGLKLLVEYGALQDDMIETLQRIFSDALKQIHDQNAQLSLQKSHDFLQKLRAKELEEYQNDEDLNKLLADI